MVYFKRLLFAPLFLVFLAYSIYIFKPLFVSTDLIFGLDLKIFLELLTFAASLTATGLFFTIFAGIASDWKIAGPVIIAGSLVPVLFFGDIYGFVLAIGIFLSLLLSYLMVENKLKNYITFQPTTLFSGPTKTLTTLMIVVVCVVYYLSINKIIADKGFEIPDSLIDAALKFSNTESINPLVKGNKYIAQLTPEQVQLLKQNPGLLKQYGVDPKVLDTIPTIQNPKAKQISPTSQISNPISPVLDIKKLVKDQFQTILKPYLTYLAVILAVLLFFTLQFLASVVFLLISPVIWITFYLLESLRIIRFEKEMREVKKMVV